MTYVVQATSQHESFEGAGHRMPEYQPGELLTHQQSFDGFAEQLVLDFFMSVEE